MEYKSLKEVSQLIGGFAFKSEFYVDNGIRVIRIANVQDGYITDERPCFYDVKYQDKIGNANLKENDLLMSLTGNVGRVAILSKDLLPAALNQRVECIRPKDIVLTKYLFYFFQNEKFREDCLKNSSGSAQLNMSTVWLSNYKIPIVSLEKQNSIIKLFDKIFDSLIKDRGQLAKLDEISKSRFYELFSNCKTVDLSSIIQPFKADRCGNKNYPVLSITMHDGLVFQKDRFKKEIASIDKSNYKIVPYNTLVVAFPIDEGLLSVQDLCEYGIVSPAYNLYSINTKIIIPQFLELILRSDESIQYYKSNLRGATLRRRTIPKEAFDKMQILLPNMQEQQEYMDFLKKINETKMLLQKRIQLHRELFNNFLNIYFGGSNSAKE